MTATIPPLSASAELRLAPSFFDDRSGAASRCRSLATMLAALWGGMEPHSATVANRSHSCLVVGVDTSTGELGLRLALAFAESGRSTTLVDAAAMQGSLRFFETTPTVAAPSNGRVPHLPGTETAVDEALLPTNVPDLTVAPVATAPADADLRRDDQVAAILDRLSAEAGGVAIIVTPPLQQAPDALPLVRHVDGVLLSVQPGRTGRPNAIRARNAILAAGGRVLGVVLSNEGGPGSGASFRLGGLGR